MRNLAQHSQQCQVEHANPVPLSNLHMTSSCISKHDHNVAPEKHKKDPQNANLERLKTYPCHIDVPLAFHSACSRRWESVGLPRHKSQPGRQDFDGVPVTKDSPGGRSENTVTCLSWHITSNPTPPPFMKPIFIHKTSIIQFETDFSWQQNQGTSLQAVHELHKWNDTNRMNDLGSLKTSWMHSSSKIDIWYIS